ncbi:MAG: hypothetical protein JXR63_04855 [Spirochaetales bacterium]|nr:hypothetical protein [Spirochaetales bacterium]
MFKEISKGFCSLVGGPKYGKQDVGISPAGVMDRFSFLTGNILLGNPDDSICYEIVFPPLLEAESDMLFVLTGAGTVGSCIQDNGTKKKIEHGVVYKILKGQRLMIGSRAYGFRTYLCFREFSPELKKIEGRSRGDFSKMARWVDSDNCIRVVEGPEYKYLENPNDFLENHWIVSSETSNMGMKLESSNKILVNLENMISEAVADGTIQFTAKGPIILLRHRQTVGGYPRGYNVISCDLDRLAQYYPGQVVHFKKVSIEQGVCAAKLMSEDIKRLRDKFI